MKPNQGILLVIFCLLSWTSFAQQICPNCTTRVVNNTTLTTGDYYARDEVDATSITGIQPSSGQQVHLYTDPSITLPPDYNSGNVGTGGINPIVRTLDVSLPVGSTQGSYQITPMGSLSYNVPISLPPGTNNMIPDLSLSYSSNGGNEIVGHGWDIAGISTIGRNGQTFFHNGQVQGVKLTNDDWFNFSGNRLIPTSGTNGSNNAEYATESESYSKITSFGTVGNGPEWFQVETKNGLTFEFGRTTDSRLIPVGQNTILIWALNKMYDKNGNYITYEFTNSDGELLIREIKYTGNDNAGIQPPYNTIKFNYNSKTDDANTTYICEGQLNSKHLLGGIEIKCEGNFYKSYKFNYSFYNVFSYLTEIEEYGSDYSKLNSMLFSYDQDESSPSSQNSNLLTLAKDAVRTNGGAYVKYIPIDFNGDGKEDLLACYSDIVTSYFDNTRWSWMINDMYAEVNNAWLTFIYENMISEVFWESNWDLLINEGNGQFNVTQSGSGFPSNFVNIDGYPLNKNSLGNMQYQKSDMNGDGNTDLILTTYDDVNYKMIFNVYLGKKEWENSAIPLDLTQPDSRIEAVIDPGSNNSTIKFLDFNGNGLLDILVYNGGTSEAKIWLDPLTNTNSPQSVQLQTTFDLGTAFASDINGDGKNELVNIIQNGNNSSYPNGDYYLTFENNSFSMVRHDPNLNYMISTAAQTTPNCNWDMNVAVDLFGDYNGDGINDLIQYQNLGSPYEWKMYLGKGNDDYEISVLSVGLADLHSIADCYHFYYSMDVNADGKTDILEFFRHVDNNYPYNYTNYNYTTLKIFYSTGTGFIPEAEYTINWLIDKSTHGIMFGDYDGNGTPDLLLYNPAISDFMPYQIIFLNKGVKSKYLTQVVNGFNALTEFEYKPLNTGGTFYSQTQNVTYPLSNYNGAVYSVSKVKAPNGIVGGISQTEYNYKNLIYDRQGKGMLGFGRIESFNTTTNTKGIDVYSYDGFFLNPYLIKSSFYNYTSGYLFSEKELEYVTTPTYGSIGYKSVLTKQTTKSHFPGSSIVNVSENTYDNDGNVIQTSTDNNGLETIIVNSPHEHAGTWGSINNVPDYVETIRIKGGETYTRRVNYDYDASNGNLLTMTQDPSTANSATTVNQYYTTGACSTRVINASSCSTCPEKKSFYEYDSKFRFVTKSKKYLSTGDQIAETKYDPRWGAPVWSKGVDGLFTRFTYDGFGRNINTIPPDNFVITTKYEWVATGSMSSTDPLNINNDVAYVVSTTRIGSPETKSYYDLSGRILESESIGFGSVKTYTQKKYNAKGNIASETGSYQSGSTPVITTYSYDDIDGQNMLKQIVVTDNNLFTNTTGIAYSYSSGNTIVTTTSPDGESSSKTTDASGNVISISDNNSGTINFDYGAKGLTKEVVVNGVTTNSMTYDPYGHRTSLFDKDAGTSYYTSDPYGQIISQTDANGNIIDNFLYDELGRMTRQNIHKGAGLYEYTYSYFPVGSNGVNQLDEIKLVHSGETYKCNYTYDEMNRKTSYKENINGQQFNMTYSYDIYGRPAKTIYPGGFFTTNEYDANGYLNKIKCSAAVNPIWQGNQMNTFGQYSQYTLGNGRTTQIDVNTFGFITKIEASGIQKLILNFDVTNGNLMSRSDQSPGRNLTESFEYDNLYRFKKSTISGVDYTVAYNTDNTISHKDDVGNYSAYANTHPDGVENVTSLVSPGISHVEQNISYTPFNKIKSVSEGDYTLNLSYGPDQARKKTELSYQNNILETRYFLGGYEKTIKGPNTSEVYYINSPTGLCAMYVVENGAGHIRYVYKDHLGSILKLTDESGNTVAEQNFDAWGINRNPGNWDYDMSSVTPVPSWLYRGFTGHEHLPEFSLVNMNGRCYDPLLGMMLSPDNNIQQPFNTLNYNRYAYAINNPLKYTDPSGDLFGIDDWIVGFFKGFFNGEPISLRSFSNGWKSGNHHIENWARIGAGMFQGNIGQILSRFSWELPQTLAGYYSADYANLVQDIKSVKYAYGATVIKNSSVERAFTLGSYIQGGDDIEADPNNALFQHEYGHYLQSQSSGWAYIPRYAIPSARSVDPHDFNAIEQDANVRAFKFWNEHVDGFYQSKSDYDNHTHGWDFFYNPIDPSGNKIRNTYIDYRNPQSMELLNSLIVTPKWFDYASWLMPGGPGIVGWINGNYYRH